MAHAYGSLQYVSPASKIARRYAAPGSELRLGEYQTHTVPIRDGRKPARPLSLDQNGFVLVPHTSRVGDFRETNQVMALYPREIEELVRQLTGAQQVVTFNFGHRSAANYRGMQDPLRCSVTTQPSTDVHVDYTPQRAGEMAYSRLMELGIPPVAVRRFMAINVWRPITEPPQDWPLTVCDASTVGPGEGIADPVVPVAVLPRLEEIPAILPPYPVPSVGMAFHFRPQHRWHYFPDMTRNEALLFVQHDSSRPNGWRTPHAAFWDAAAANAVPRESVEIRAFAYFF